MKTEEDDDGHGRNRIALRAMDERAAILSRNDRIEAVLHAVWMTLGYEAHRTPGGYLTDEGERFLRGELEQAL